MSTGRVLSVCGALARNIDERERHVDHALEVGDRDVLVRRVDLHHPVREVHTFLAALVEDVRIRTAAREPELRLNPCAPEGRARERYREVTTVEPVAAVALRDRALRLALLERCRERDRLEDLPYEVRELLLRVRPHVDREGA